MNGTPNKKQRLFLAEDPNDLVWFKVIDQDKLVKISKSTAIEASPVLKELIENNEFSPDNPITVDDVTDFNLSTGFLAFVEAVHENDAQAWLVNQRNWDDTFYTFGFNRVRQVHFFANKYQVESLIDQCTEAAKILVDMYVKDPEVAAVELPACLEMVRALELNDYMAKVRKVSLELTEALVLEKFDLAMKWDIKEFLDQVVIFCCFLEPDETWPQELLTLVIKELKTGMNRKEWRKKLKPAHDEVIFSRRR